jgi:hypothetical protein
VSVDIAAPHPCAPGTTRVERQVQADGTRHGGHRHEGERGEAPALAQLPDGDLALGLEPDDEEEERHQPLVDPVAQVHRDHRVAQPDRQLGPQTES